MSNKRLRIINRQKSLKRHKQWHIGLVRRLKGCWTIEHKVELERLYGLDLEQELVTILTEEIIRESKEEGLGNPYPNQEIIDYMKEYVEEHELLKEYVKAHSVIR